MENKVNDVMETAAEVMEINGGNKEFGLGILVGLGAVIFVERALVPGAKWVSGKLKGKFGKKKETAVTDDVSEVIVEIVEE